MEVRTRYAPSPTGFMHVGNLRTALFEYLIARSNSGKFILRIEDTDQDRFVEGSTDIIYKTLNATGLKYDEGPDIGGDFGPYIQSQRKDIYMPYAEKLINENKAYRCFCTKERLEKLAQTDTAGYDKKCRNLTSKEIEFNLKNGTPYVIRQKMPETGSTTFCDDVFGEITVENSELSDQILVKSDGFPTYNFANVIDDHTMGITHVVRGSEYLSSTPKYNLLYEALGFDIPVYVHLPLIMGKNEDGSVSKLSKRHGSTSFEDLVSNGYLPQTIVNYIALLGWCPKDNREFFTLTELEQIFSIDGISKSPAVFDYDKLSWMNGEYIRLMSTEAFIDAALEQFKIVFKNKDMPLDKIAAILQPRVTQLTQIPSLVDFLNELPDYTPELYINKKSKTTLENAPIMLLKAYKALKYLAVWDQTHIHDCLISLAGSLQVKNGTLMWPVRIAVSGRAVTPGGAVEILDILGREESLIRMERGLNMLEDYYDN